MQQFVVANPIVTTKRSRTCLRPMSSSTSLYQRRRAATAEEIDAIPWMHSLLPAERERAIAALQVTQACAGEYLCHAGKTVTYWLGLIDGLL